MKKDVWQQQAKIFVIAWTKRAQVVTFLVQNAIPTNVAMSAGKLRLKYTMSYVYIYIFLQTFLIITEVIESGCMTRLK